MTKGTVKDETNIGETINADKVYRKRISQITRKKWLGVR